MPSRDQKDLFKGRKKQRTFKMSRTAGEKAKGKEKAHAPVRTPGGDWVGEDGGSRQGHKLMGPPSKYSSAGEPASCRQRWKR